jgi:hypothetical protein
MACRASRPSGRLPNLCSTNPLVGSYPKAITEQAAVDMRGEAVNRVDHLHPGASLAGNDSHDASVTRSQVGSGNESASVEVNLTSVWLTGHSSTLAISRGCAASSADVPPASR